MLDSGTTFTYLPSEAFQLFKEAITAYALAHGLHSVKGPDPKVRPPLQQLAAAHGAVSVRHLKALLHAVVDGGRLCAPGLLWFEVVRTKTNRRELSCKG